MTLSWLLIAAVVVVVPMGWALVVRRLSSGPEIIAQWAAEHGGQVVALKRRWITALPFSVFDITGKTVFKVVVTRRGHSNSAAWILCADSDFGRKEVVGVKWEAPLFGDYLVFRSA